MQVAAVTAALVAAWLVGSSSMHWKFYSDHFTFLKFENLSSGSEVMTYFMSTLTHCGQTHRQTDRQTHRPSCRVDLALWAGSTKNPSSGSKVKSLQSLILLSKKPEK